MLILCKHQLPSFLPSFISFLHILFTSFSLLCSSFLPSFLYRRFLFDAIKLFNTWVSSIFTLSSLLLINQGILLYSLIYTFLHILHTYTHTVRSVVWLITYQIRIKNFTLSNGSLNKNHYFTALSLSTCEHHENHARLKAFYATSLRQTHDLLFSF